MQPSETKVFEVFFKFKYFKQDLWNEGFLKLNLPNEGFQSFLKMQLLETKVFKDFL